MKKKKKRNKESKRSIKKKFNSIKFKSYDSPHNVSVIFLIAI